MNGNINGLVLLTSHVNSFIKNSLVWRKVNRLVTAVHVNVVIDSLGESDVLPSPHVKCYNMHAHTYTHREGECKNIPSHISQSFLIVQFSILPVFYLSYFYPLHLPALSTHVVFPLQSPLAVTFSPVEQDTAHLHLPHALMICGKLRASVWLPACPLLTHFQGRSSARAELSHIPCHPQGNADK